MANKHFDIHRFARDHRVDVAPAGHKHNRPGWVNVPCPFCTGNPGYHLGYAERKGIWNCHRCRWHGPVDTIQALLGIGWARAKEIFEAYGGRPIQAGEDTGTVVRPRTVVLPQHTRPLCPAARRYLRGRGFAPGDMVKHWQLASTGSRGPYKFRIIAPIMLEGQLVSYQGRDYTDRAPLKYKACALDKEVVPHQHILYGLDCVPGHTAVIVEGVTDVWRLGPGAVGTFGTEWTREQLNILRQFPRRFVLYDSGEVQAYVQALALANALSGFSGITELLELKKGGDPGALSQAEAVKLMNQIIMV